MKRINSENLNSQDENNVANEIKIHSKLSHKFLVDFVDAFFDQNFIYLILGYVEKGNLYLHIDPKNGMEENWALRIFAQIVDVV